MIIDLEPIGSRLEIDPGTTLLDAARSAGVDIVALCGGGGICGTCRVRLMAGELTALTGIEEEVLQDDEIREGFRLACQAKAVTDVKIHIPPESLTTPQRLQIEGEESIPEDNPVIHVIDLCLEAPDLNDLVSDVSRLKAALVDNGVARPEFNSRLLSSLSDVIRKQNWCARFAIRGEEVVAVLQLKTRVFGLAVDLGTTKIAAYLLDLEHGRTVAKNGAMNPQIGHGEDVITRIAYCNQNTHGRKILQERAVDTLNEMIVSMCGEISISPAQVVEAVVVGNTAMHHMFAGLPVEQLGLSPYVPSVSDELDIAAMEVGLKISAGAHLYLPPNIAGYVGADHVAMVIGSHTDEALDTVVAVDIGTNTEITLAHEGRYLSCSCASGPAFEGAHIHNGMRAASGAIERIQMTDGRINIHTINNQPAIGICGSGILDAVAEMLRTGVINERGVFNPQNQHVRGTGRSMEFVLVPEEMSGTGKDIVVNRKDINEIQLAKSAIRAGIEMLMIEAGITAEKIDRFIVAGAFGTYLDIDNAIRIGMFPKLPRHAYSQVGNAAGAGARQMLVSMDKRKAAEELASREEYVELTVHPAFRDVYMEGMYFS